MFLKSKAKCLLIIVFLTFANHKLSYSKEDVGTIRLTFHPSLRPLSKYLNNLLDAYLIAAFLRIKRSSFSGQLNLSFPEFTQDTVLTLPYSMRVIFKDGQLSIFESNRNFKSIILFNEINKLKINFKTQFYFKMRERLKSLEFINMPADAASFNLWLDFAILGSLPPAVYFTQEVFSQNTFLKFQHKFNTNFKTSIEAYLRATKKKNPFNVEIRNMKDWLNFLSSVKDFIYWALTNKHEIKSELLWLPISSCSGSL
jgi:hypothetical protein